MNSSDIAYWIPTTIRQVYFDKILAGEKTIERKVSTYHWDGRLERAAHELVNGRKVGASFICGRKSAKFNVLKVKRIVKQRVRGQPGVYIDGVEAWVYWEIYLGGRVS